MVRPDIQLVTLASRWLSRRRLARAAERGFTLIEMVMVISIMLILISMAAPRYAESMVRAREAVLKQNLFSLRSTIDQFTIDKNRAPQSLDELVQAGYLRQIPVDPMTGSRDTWVVAQEDVMLSVDQTQPGITDVHSGSTGTGSDGIPYSEW
jgi:general secretion pathway protein G